MPDLSNAELTRMLDDMKQFPKTRNPLTLAKRAMLRNEIKNRIVRNLRKS